MEAPAERGEPPGQQGGQFLLGVQNLRGAEIAFAGVVEGAEDDLRAVETGQAAGRNAAQMAGGQVQALHGADARRAVGRGLLQGMVAKGTERGGLVDEVTLGEQVEPHFLIYDLSQCRVEAASAGGAAKHHGAGFADQVAILAQAADHDIGTGLGTGGAEMIPHRRDGVALVDHEAGRDGECGPRVLIQ